ncbi:MAG: peroxidase-related enzyme [Alphaproteobacteria bacterium]|nr:peroxidase-related enzyme [Alphaproteobacteria bacterium]
MAELFPSLPEPPTMADVFKKFPHTFRPLVEYHDRLLRDYSPLTVGQRELIAAYVSGLNACQFCYGAHNTVARAFGIEDEIFTNLIDDVDRSAVDEAMKPILRYVKKLTLSPTRMTAADAAAVYAAGWSEQALFDAVSVCALFNFMNRIIEGTGLKPLPAGPEMQSQDSQMRSFMGGDDPATLKDAHESKQRYTALIDLWGIERES